MFAFWPAELSSSGSHHRFLTCLSLLALSACTILPNAGPSTTGVANADKRQLATSNIKVVDLTPQVVQTLTDISPTPRFDRVLGDAEVLGATIGKGDVVDISIWEAPLAVLFGNSVADGRSIDGLGTARSSQIPSQMVGSNGLISVPFVGQIQAEGRTTDAIAQEIRKRLVGKAHEPQVIVSLSRNATRNVTIVGEVANSARMPLTAKGERLLDALASVGGVKQPIGKMTIQVTRGDKVAAMALEAVIRDPQQNIHLQPDDVVTLLFQPFSFTVLGAARTNQEIPFEGTGLTLSQALGRMGGLDDQRANPKGVFIFRFEDPKLFAASEAPIATAKDGKVPVIYRVNMRDPATLFVAQSFQIKDKDVIYVSNAPLADFAKFLQAVSQIVYPIAVIQTTNVF